MRKVNRREGERRAECKRRVENARRQNQIMEMMIKKRDLSTMIEFILFKFFKIQKLKKFRSD